MSFCPNHTMAQGAVDWAEAKAQQRAFADCLTHDDRDSYYVVAWTSDGRWHQRAYRGESLDFDLVPKSESVYMTRNGFTTSVRDVAHCRQVNAMMFDIDCHDGDFERVIPVALDVIRRAVERGRLPHPTITVDTGRGIQVYYVLERSTSTRKSDGTANDAGLSYFRDVEAGLASAFEAEISDIKGLTLDPSAFDLARVGRVPGTINPKAGRMCELVETGPYHELAALRKYARAAHSPTPTRKRRASASSDSSLLRSRLFAIERLQRHRSFDCRGSRENMCFVFYNTATQIHGPQRALDLTLRFNARFSYPLPPTDIEQIARTVDSVVIRYGRHAGERGFYPLSAKSVVGKLMMTDDETLAVGFFGSARKRKRAHATLRRKAARDSRNERIVHEYKMGRTLDQVANIVKCSRRTVASVLSSRGISRHDRYSLEEKFSLVIESRRQSAERRHTSWLCAPSSRSFSHLPFLGTGNHLVTTPNPPPPPAPSSFFLYEDCPYGYGHVGWPCPCEQIGFRDGRQTPDRAVRFLRWRGIA